MVQKGHLVCLGGQRAVDSSEQGTRLCPHAGYLCGLQCVLWSRQGEALGWGWHVLLEQSRKTSVRKRYLSKSLKPGKSCWRSVLVSGDSECQGCRLGQGLQCSGSERGPG